MSEAGVISDEKENGETLLGRRNVKKEKRREGVRWHFCGMQIQIRPVLETAE